MTNTLSPIMTKTTAARYLEAHGFHYPDSYRFEADGSLRCKATYSNGPTVWEAVPRTYEGIRNWLGY